MSRNQQHRQPSNGSGQQPLGGDEGPEDREAERGDERIGSAHELGYGDQDGHNSADAAYDLYGGDFEYHAEHRLPDRDDDEADIAEADVMEVLDHDDLTQMDGPDA